MIFLVDNCLYLFLLFLRFWKFKVMTCEVAPWCLALDRPGPGYASKSSFVQSVEEMHELGSCQTAWHGVLRIPQCSFSFHLFGFVVVVCFWTLELNVRMDITCTGPHFTVPETSIKLGYLAPTGTTPAVRGRVRVIEQGDLRRDSCQPCLESSSFWAIKHPSASVLIKGGLNTLWS